MVILCDLVIYVYYDVFYEVYLNVCLSFLVDGVFFDLGILFGDNDFFDK